MKIRVIMKRPDKEPYVTNISDTLENMQKTVGGHIEVFSLSPDFAIICNEEGKLLGMEPNFRIGGQYFVGTCFVVGTKGEEFCDCPIDLKTLRLIVPDMWRVNNG